MERLTGKVIPVHRSQGRRRIVDKREVIGNHLAPLQTAQQAAGAVLIDAQRLQSWRNGHSPSPLGKAALGSFMNAR